LFDAYLVAREKTSLSERWWRRRRHRESWFDDFGFSVTIRPNADPRFRRLIKQQPSGFGFEMQEEPEPLVDVNEQEGEVVIIAELPGVKKEDILIHATQRQVTISVNTPERRYRRELTLPVETDPSTAVATYKNGVLQLRLKKALVGTQLLTK